MQWKDIFLLGLIFCCVLVICQMWLRDKSELQGMKNKKMSPIPYRDIVGRYLWFYLHAIADNYPLQASADEQKNFQEHVASFALNFPCRDCRDHMSVYIKNHPLYTVDNRAKAVYWMFSFHNEVNRRLGKQIMPKEAYYTRFAEHEPPIIMSSFDCNACQHI